jgi:hypothetical protein
LKVLLIQQETYDTLCLAMCSAMQSSTVGNTASKWTKSSPIPAW